MGEAHVYSNHVTPLLEQLKRTPNEFPKLRFKRQVSEWFKILFFKQYKLTNCLFVFIVLMISNMKISN